MVPAGECKGAVTPREVQRWEPCLQEQAWVSIAPARGISQFAHTSETSGQRVCRLAGSLLEVAFLLLSFVSVHICDALLGYWSSQALF